MFAEFFTKNLDVVFLISGASYVAMAVAIYAQPHHESSFRLADIMGLLAGFGMAHGINEWLYMFALIKKDQEIILTNIRAIALTIAFVFLFEFGRRLIILSLKKFLNKWITIVLYFLVFVLIAVTKENPVIWPRYLLGFPGGIFSAYGFILYYRNNKTILSLFKTHKYFIAAAVSLAAYGILGGIFVPKANFFPASFINNTMFFHLFGIPVQVFRAVCAIILVWSIYKILDIFEWEMINELKSSLQEVRTAKNFVENILTSMIDTLIVVDVNGTIRAVNNAMCQVSGYEKKELIGTPIRKLFEGNIPPEGADLKKLLENGYYRNYEISCIAKNKEKIPLLFSQSVMKNWNGEITEYVGVGKDLRELKNLKEKLNRSEKFAAMGKVSGIIGHELKNELGIMRNAVYYIKLKLKNTDEKIDKYLTMLDDEIVEIDRTIENILTFAKTRQPEFKNVDLKALLSKVLERMPIPKDITLTTDIEEGLPKISADELQISRVFINIILNALDAMEKEGKLDIIIKHINGNVFIRFNDTGSGIKKEDKNKIFEPFFSTKTKGTGLGLATSKIIIEAHGGNIDIESEINNGTSIIIKLPINKG